MNWVKLQALTLVIPMLLGPLAYWIIQTLKRNSQWVDNLSPLFKKGAVFLCVTGLVTLSNLGGIPINCNVDGNLTDCVNQLSPEAVKVALGTVAAMLMHKVKKQSPNS